MSHFTSRNKHVCPILFEQSGRYLAHYRLVPVYLKFLFWIQYNITTFNAIQNINNTDAVLVKYCIFKVAIFQNCVKYLALKCMNFLKKYRISGIKIFKI